jgi:hypothetical protein
MQQRCDINDGDSQDAIVEVKVAVFVINIVKKDASLYHTTVHTTTHLKSCAMTAAAVAYHHDLLSTLKQL